MCRSTEAWVVMKEEQERTPLRTILQNFLNHVENLDTLSDDSYDKEFQSLKLFSESLKNIKHYACTEGEKEVNKKKNRYKDILPFDYTRVILSGIPGVQGSDYVNANFIKGASGSLAYIASQGPLPHTANDFWRMVVECEVQVIVMACNEEESGKHKCEHYWTDNEGEEKQFGIATIRLVKASVVCPDFLVRTMQLKYKKNDTAIERTVCQFHYSAWPDHGVPPLVRPLLDMVRLVRDTQASETLPVLIHCSAGCGRTGTICAIDYVWGLLRAGKLTRDFSLLKLVRDMRKQRIAMVQTKDQYVLVHKAVRELFQEQLKMIDAHPYENVDLNGVSLLKDEPLYEQLKGDNLDVSEKQDNKEKEILSQNTFGNVEREDKMPTTSFTREDKTPTTSFPHKKPCSHTAPSKQEKEVENQTQKQLSSWCISESEDLTANASCSSTTDSSILVEKLPKRCPLPKTLPENHISVDQLLIHRDEQVATVSPSKSSLLQKPRIAKLKALFERSPNCKSPKNRNKVYDETDLSDIHKAARPSQQVTRSHSLGAVRKPSKFSQFQSAENPVSLYRKLFPSTNDSKKVNVSPKESKAETVISNSSDFRNEPSHSRNAKKTTLPDSEPVVKLNDSRVGKVDFSPGVSSRTQNVRHDQKPALPVKRSKSLKVVGSFAKIQQPKETKSTFQQQLSSLLADDPNEIETVPDSSSNANLSGRVEKTPSKDRSKSSNSKNLPTPRGYNQIKTTPVHTAHFNGSALDIVTRDPRNKEYVNISELKSNWHQDGPKSHPLSKSQSAVQLPAHSDNGKTTCDYNAAARKPLDGGMQKIISECRKYLMGAQDPGVTPPEVVEEDEINNGQFDSLSLEAQRKINNIVGGIGIRERRNSFRKAVCHDTTDSTNKISSPKRKVKDYEPIWLQDECVQNHNGQWVHSARPNDEHRFPPPTLAPSAMHSNSSLSSSGTSSSSGKRLLEFDNLKPTMTPQPNPTYHVLTPSSQLADQRNHLHQRALAQAMHSRVSNSRITNRQPSSAAAMFPDPTKIEHMHPDANSRMPNSSSRQPTSSSAMFTDPNSNSRQPPSSSAAMFTDPTKIEHVHPDANTSPAYRKINSNTDSYGMIQQQRAAGMPQGFSLTSGPLAPPRTKRHTLSHHQRNSMIETAIKSSELNKDPIYANTTQIKASQDEWHGGLGVDVDTVAASMKQTPAQTESSTSLTRAFDKLSTKASNMRTKMSPKSDTAATQSMPNPDTRQQGVSGSSRTRTSQGQPATTPHVRKQQQYL